MGKLTNTSPNVGHVMPGLVRQKNRGIRDEEHGERDSPEVENSDADRVAAFRHESLVVSTVIVSTKPQALDSTFNICQ
jgi:hypothetical protein